MSTISSIRSTKNKHDAYRGKDCMKKFSEFLKEHAMKIINFKKKKMKLLTKEQQKLYGNAKICYICYIYEIYVTYYNLLIAQDLWQANYQILSIICVKEFIELNINSDTMIKNVKHVELSISIVTVFLNTQILKII